MRKEQLDKLIVKLGDSMNEFLIAEIELLKADKRFKKAQSELSWVEDQIRLFKHGEVQLEPIKNL